HVDRGCVLLEVAAPLRSRDRDDVGALREHPGDRELRRRDALLRSDLLDLRRDAEIRVEVVAREPRSVAAEVVLVELVRRGESAGEKAAAERRVGNESDPELAA